MRKIQNQIRKNSLLDYGFGTDAMKGSKVCKNCNSLEPSSNVYCRKCKARLPSTTLYDLYKAQHKSCEKCGAVVSANMQFCPNCGQSIKNKIYQIKEAE